MLLANPTEVPPLGAEPLNVTVHDKLLPAVIVPLPQVRAVTVTELLPVPAAIVNVTVCETPLYVAVTAAAAAVATVPADAKNVPVVVPAGMRIVAGTESAGKLLATAILIPPWPAACVSVTVHDDTPPDGRTVGEQSRLDSVGEARVDPIVLSNSTGCNPLTSAMTLTIDPVAPEPSVRLTEAWP